MKKIIIAIVLLAIILWPKDKAPAETITREVNEGGHHLHHRCRRGHPEG